MVHRGLRQPSQGGYISTAASGKLLTKPCWEVSVELGQNRSRDASNRVERDHGVDSGLAQSAAETYFVCFPPSLAHSTPAPLVADSDKVVKCSSFEVRKSAQFWTEIGDALSRTDHGAISGFGEKVLARLGWRTTEHRAKTAWSWGSAPRAKRDSRTDAVNARPATARRRTGRLWQTGDGRSIALRKVSASF